MKILSLFVSVALFANCKAHQGGEESHSETESLKSDDGSMLVVMFGSESVSVISSETGKRINQRYCVLWMPSDRHSGKKPKLLTPLGGLREKQLKDTLVAASKAEAITLFVLSPMTGFIVPALGPGVVIAAVAVVGTGTHLVANRIVSSKRVKALIDEDRIVKISNKVMARSIGKILAAKPDLQGLGTCDHIKKSKIITES